MNKHFVLPFLFLTLPLAAEEWPGPDTIGFQARVSKPLADLSDAVGSPAPGIGASLQVELHFDSTICGRVDLGADDWSKLGGSSARSVRALHLGGEVVYFLIEDRDTLLRGPYLTAGLQAVYWSLGANASGTGTSLDTVHPGYTAGFGYRVSRRVDLELKVMASPMTSNQTAGAVMACVTFRL
jgi:hypothetical protein